MSAAVAESTQKASAQQQDKDKRPILGPPKLATIDFTNDVAHGKQYTNFEKKKSNKKPSKWEKVNEKLPEGLGTFEVTIDPDNIYFFSGKGNNWMANFYKAPMNIDGHVYPSVEHYYQACKLYMLGGARLSNQIRRIADGGQVKSYARRLLQNVATYEQVEEWKMMHGPLLLQHALIHKYVQHAGLRNKLLETEDKLLVHAYEGDKVYACGMPAEKFTEWAKENKGNKYQIPLVTTGDSLEYFPKVGEGKNVLGFLMMRVRDDIRKFQERVSVTGSDGVSNQDPIMAAAMAALQLNDAPSGGSGDDKLKAIAAAGGKKAAAAEGPAIKKDAASNGGGDSTGDSKEKREE